ncbi:MAG: hypothetical protein JNK05_20840 [Myxococcales bacterium]|nr:hypothetical protein [Myxococcales bacterium]
MAFAFVAGCAPGSELVGRWSTDLRSTFAAANAAQYASFELRVTFGEFDTYLLETRAVAAAAATNGADCTTVLVSRGGTWSVSTTSGVNTLETTPPLTGTAERFGCRNRAENFTPQPTSGAATWTLASGTYRVSGNSLVYSPRGGSSALTFTRV